MDDRLCPARYVAATITDDGGMLLDLRGQGRWYLLSPTAARWWAALAGDCTVEEATAAVADHYGVARDRVHADIAGVIAELRRRRLLVQQTPRWWWPW